MGLFGKLFEKKTCDICDGEIGLLGNRKLEDGNLCKNCARKLSPWFEDRRHSTVADIRAQLQYRQENQTRVNQFCTTRALGENSRVLLDEGHGWLAVSRQLDMRAENPDVLDFSAITGCRVDIQESRREVKYEDSEGNRVSYNPPRHEYSYNFYMIITVNNPYFDDMRFCLNTSTIEFEDGPNMAGRRTGGFLDLARSTFDPMNNPDYRYYYNLSQEICQAVREAQTQAQKGSAQPQSGTAAQAPAPAAPTPSAENWVCTACGAENNGKFCEFCGTPRS